MTLIGNLPVGYHSRCLPLELKKDPYAASNDQGKKQEVKEQSFWINDFHQAAYFHDEYAFF